MAESESYHFTRAEPEKRVVLRGRPGVFKITNAGPAGVVVRNKQNNLRLGAGTRAQLHHDGETVITIDPSDANDHTSGTLEGHNR